MPTAPRATFLAPNGLKVGDQVECGAEADIKPGNALALKNIPLGTFVHAIEMKPGAGAQLARGAGTQAQLMAKEGKFALLKLPSGEQRMVQARMSCDGRPGRQYRPREYLHRQGGTQSMGLVSARTCVASR